MALRHVHPTAIGSGSGGHVPTRNPDGGGVREEAGEALRELREEAAVATGRRPRFLFCCHSLLHEHVVPVVWSMEVATFFPPLSLIGATVQGASGRRRKMMT